MALRSIIFKAVVSEKCMRGQRNIANCYSSHEVNVSLWQCKNILFNFSGSRLSFLALNFFNSKYLVDWSNYVSKDVVFRNDIRESSVSVNDGEFIRILIVPEYFINSICYQLEVMIRFSSGEEEVNLTILVLEDEFCSIFVRKNSENRVIWLVFHDHIFVFNVIIFQSVCVI